MTAASALSLAPVLDTAAAGPLRVALRTAIAAGDPLTLGGGSVDRIGLACLQVLAAGRAAAEAAGLPFTIDSPSSALVDYASLAGLGDLVAG